MSWKAIACAALALLRPEARDRQPAGAALEGVPVGVMAGMGCDDGAITWPSRPQVTT